MKYLKYRLGTASVVSCISLLAALLLVACIDPADTNDSGSNNTASSIDLDLSKATKQGGWMSLAHTMQGTWYIVPNGAKQQVVFGTDFSTDGGPDLYLYLSPKEPSAITSTNGATDATEISALSSTPGSTFKGPVTVDLPEGTDLSLYKSIIIHCKQYNATWGVGTL